MRIKAPHRLPFTFYLHRGELAQVFLAAINLLLICIVIAARLLVPA
jgi:hypothetical protein